MHSKEKSWRHHYDVMESSIVTLHYHVHTKFHKNRPTGRGERAADRQTESHYDTIELSAREPICYDIVLQKVSLDIVVVDYNRIGTSDPIGHVELGCNARGAELRHWSDMLTNQHSPVAQWHTLQEVPKKN